MVPSLTPLPSSYRKFWRCPLSMFLYVVATKVVTHFNDNVKELKGVQAREQQIKVVNFDDDSNFF